MLLMLHIDFNVHEAVLVDGLGDLFVHVSVPV